jgi:hypothetical protein
VDSLRRVSHRHFRIATIFSLSGDVAAFGPLPLVFVGMDHGLAELVGSVIGFFERSAEGLPTGADGFVDLFFEDGDALGGVDDFVFHGVIGGLESVFRNSG